jgi:hypothetical protein
MKEHIILQRLADVYNNNRDHSWFPTGIFYYIDEDLVIQATRNIEPNVIYFKSLDIAMTCSNIYYGTEYKIIKCASPYVLNEILKGNE